MRNLTHPTDSNERDSKTERSYPTEQNHDPVYDDRGYDDGLVHGHAWAVSSSDR